MRLLRCARNDATTLTTHNVAEYASAAFRHRLYFTCPGLRTYKSLSKKISYKIH